MNKLFFIMTGVLIIFSSTDACSQKEKYQSLFIYNFSKYVKWPEEKQNEEFVIGVLGSSEIISTLKSMAENKNVNGARIIVKQYNSVHELSDCHILYVSDKEASNIDEVISSTSGKSILIVTDKPGFAKKGAVINFIEQDGKIKLELNQQYAESRGLKVSGSLVSLAILV